MSGIHARERQKQQGFTLVELLIVIVVIAILAAITTVAYSGIQARANDARMVAGVNQLEKALRLWVIDHPLPIRGGYESTVAVSNGACSDGEDGWIATHEYVCTVEDALVSSGNLPSGFLRNLPKTTYLNVADGAYSTMLYICGTGTGRYALYWTLQKPSAGDTTNFNSTRTTCGHGTEIRDDYGMRAGKILQF